MRNVQFVPFFIVFHAFISRLLSGGDLGMQKWVKPWTQALRTFYFHMGDKKAHTQLQFKAEKKIQMKGTEEEHIISLWSLQQRLCGRGNIWAELSRIDKMNIQPDQSSHFRQRCYCSFLVAFAFIKLLFWRLKLHFHRNFSKKYSCT